MSRILKNMGLVLMVLVGFAAVILTLCAVSRTVRQLFHPVDCSCCTPKTS